MFSVINAALRTFIVGVVVGMLFAPRPGVATRRMLNERIATMVKALVEMAALPPIEPSQAGANGQPERPASKRSRAAKGTGARTPS